MGSKVLNMVSAFEGNPEAMKSDLEKCIEIEESDSSYNKNAHSIFAGRLFD